MLSFDGTSLLYASCQVENLFNSYNFTVVREVARAFKTVYIPPNISTGVNVSRVNNKEFFIIYSSVA